MKISEKTAIVAVFSRFFHVFFEAYFRPWTKKRQAERLVFLLAGYQIARSTLFERRHLVQTYTWRGVPSTIAFTRLTLGFHARLDLL